MEKKSSTPIAIVGVSCRFPGGANSPRELWELLINGTNTWSHVPTDRYSESAFLHPSPDDTNGSHNHSGGHFLDQDIRDFDSDFFNITSHEAAAMDPQQRILLETVYEALESAGQQQDRLRGSATSVHVAMFTRDYDRNMYKDTLNIPRYQAIGTGEAILSNRISHVFDFRGPSMTLDTGCSGGLVALHQACLSLRSRESNMAVVGAANLILGPDQQIGMSNLHMLSPHGRSYSFDQRGSGYGRGEGFATFVLKRLDIAVAAKDPIRAIILGSAVNQDGRTAAGITYPNGAAQTALVRRLYQNLDLDPRNVTYVEAHGTGTVVGDREEMDSLAEVFCKERSTPLYVGSIKSNIGHLECTSGLAGLIKSILMLEHRQIPANADFTREKLGLRLRDRGITIPTVIQTWPRYISPIISINSFGYGGTNAHVVLECASPADLSNSASNDTAKVVPRLFVFSAKSQVSLRSVIARHRAWISAQGSSLSLSSLSYTLCTRRTSHPWRFSCVAIDHEDLINQLTQTARIHNSNLDSNHTPINFVFTGQGAQWPGMCRELLLAESPSGFKSSMHRSKDIFLSFGAAWDLIEEVLCSNDQSRIDSAELAQPATTAIQIALVDLLRDLRIYPSAVIGHSSGEIAAAYAAGYLSHSTALRISFYRGFTPRISRTMGFTKGAMLVVGLDEVDASKYITKITKGTISIACLNSPESTTISGDEEAIDELVEMLNSMEIFNRRLRVDTAYHSHHMQAAAERYRDLIGTIKVESQEARVKFFSTVNARENSGGFDAQYWVENLVSKVRFQESMQQLCQAQTSHRQLFLEIGPHNALAGPTRQCIVKTSDPIHMDYLSPIQRGKDAMKSVLEVIGNLFERGKRVDLDTLSELDPEIRNAEVLHDLPSYSWDHVAKHWHESRLSRDHRLRKHPYHDLLGIRSPESTSIEPRWRHMISVTTLPWLMDHVVDGLTIFPGSGYICMAIEAISQLGREIFPDRRAHQVTLRNIEFLRALLVPDPPERTEAQLSFTPVIYDSGKSSRLHFHFRVSAFAHDHTWDEHCRGSIDIAYETDDDFVTSNVDRPERDTRLNNSEIISREEIYKDLERNGNLYGPAFTGINSITMDDDWTIAAICIPDVARTMPARYLQPHIIHPTTLDIVMHSSLPMANQKIGPGSIMPVRIGELVVSPNNLNEPGAIMSAYSDIASTQSRTAEVDIDVFNEGSVEPTLSMSGVELRLLTSPSSSRDSQNVSRNICWEMLWVPDVNLYSAGNFTRPKDPKENWHSLRAKVEILNKMTSFYLKRCLNIIHDGQLIISDEYRLLFEWMLRHTKWDRPNVQTENIYELHHRPLIPEIPQFTEMELLIRIGDQLPAILTGAVNALHLVVEDDLLYKAYREDSSTLDYDLLRQYVKHLSYKKSRLRVLEIGAGTGGATLPFLQTMEAAGFSPEVYDFTDISTGFFDHAASMLSAYSVNYRKLDIEQDPVQQGFEPLSYDVVLASNCLHVTSHIRTTLKNARSLLKPDGRLILIEMVNPQPFHHATFGTLAGYWKGSVDGRPDGPFMTVDAWRQALKDVFMDLQLNVNDGETEHLNSLMIARPRDDNRSALTKRLQIIPVDESQSTLALQIQAGFKEEAISVSVEGFDHGLDNDQVIHIVLDNGKFPLLSDITPEKFHKLCAMMRRPSCVLWISANNDPSTFVNPRKHLITGLSRTAHAENEDLRFIIVDVQQEIYNKKTKFHESIRNCLHRSFSEPYAEVEREYVYRNDTFFISRLVPSRTISQWASNMWQSTQQEEIDFTSRPLNIYNDDASGSTGFMFTIDETHRVKPLKNNIEIQVRAVGISSNDFNSKHFEYSGTVLALGSHVTEFVIGDRVLAVGSSACVSRPQISTRYVQHIPSQMSYNLAAGLPRALMAACYVMYDLLDILPSQKLLIQGVHNIVAQALLLIARHEGAKVVVLAYHQSEVILLKEQLQIPAECIVHNSPLSRKKAVRSLAPFDDLDSIVTCDTLDIPTHVAFALNPFGTIVKLQSSIPKRDDLRHCPQLPANITLHTCDIDALLQTRPQKATELLKRAGDLLKMDLPFSRLPIAVEDITDAKDVMRRLHMGSKDIKTILEAKEGSMVSVITPKASDFNLESAATFVIAGGLGDLGQKLILHLAKHGVNHIVTLSRRNLRESDRQRLEHDIHRFSRDCQLHHIQCDISRDEQVKAAAASITLMGLPPVKGVIQSAMVLQDRTLDSMNAEDFQIPLEPKVSGTLNLHKTFGDMDLDFFIMLSSAANIAGTSGQGNYNAGNAVQDALAHSAKSKRCHYLTFSPGMIEGADVLQDDETRVNALRRSGFTPIQEDELENMLDYLLSPAARVERCSLIAAGFDSQSMINAVSANGNVRSPTFTHVLAVKQIEIKEDIATKEKSFTDILQTVSANELLAYTTTAVTKKLSNLISADAETMDMDKAVSDFGLDSLIAIELRNWIKRTFQTSMKPLEILDEQSIRTLAEKIISRSQLVQEAQK